MSNSNLRLFEHYYKLYFKLIYTSESVLNFKLDLPLNPSTIAYTVASEPQSFTLFKNNRYSPVQ